MILILSHPIGKGKNPQGARQTERLEAEADRPPAGPDPGPLDFAPADPHRIPAELGRMLDALAQGFGHRLLGREIEGKGADAGTAPGKTPELMGKEKTAQTAVVDADETGGAVEIDDVDPDSRTVRQF